MGQPPGVEMACLSGESNHEKLAKGGVGNALESEGGEKSREAPGYLDV